MAETFRDNEVILEYYIADHDITDPQVIAKLIMSYNLAYAIDALEFALESNKQEIERIIELYKNELKRRKISFVEMHVEE